MGSKEAVALTDKTVEHAGTLLETGVESGEARASIVTLLTGQVLTAEQQQAIDDGIQRLADLLDEFTELAHRETTRSWWR